MTTVSSRSISFHILLATAVAALHTMPAVSQAQTETATGFDALFSNTTGIWNTAIGAYTLAYNTTGEYNEAFGYGALYKNTTGSNGTATGVDALLSNTTGTYNTASGSLALYTNTTGNYNTASGANALYFNLTGSSNTANGYNALYNNTAGTQNVAAGSGSLYANTTGSYNTAIGYNALTANNAGADNTAVGNGALHANVSGSGNSANGVGALLVNTSGGTNTAFGYDALSRNTIGSYNTGLGNSAGSDITTGSYNIDIGNNGSASDNGIIRIGTAANQTETYIAGISGKTASGGVEVFINSSGQLGTVTSSRRFKFDIKGIGATSDKLMDLRPVMFRYKQANEDGTHPIQYGLIAEEVAKVYPDLVQYDKQGKPFTVYYRLLTPMMLNELQKAHREIDSLKAGQRDQSAALQTQSSAVVSLQHTVCVLMVVVAGIVVACLVGAACLLLARARRQPTFQSRPIEGCMV